MGIVSAGPGNTVALVFFSGIIEMCMSSPIRILMLAGGCVVAAVLRDGSRRAFAGRRLFQRPDDAPAGGDRRLNNRARDLWRHWGLARRRQKDQVRLSMSCRLGGLKKLEPQGLGVDVGGPSPLRQ